MLALLLSVARLSAAEPARIGPLLEQAYRSLGDSDQSVIIVYLTDKGNQRIMPMSEARSLLSDRAIARRLKVGTPDALMSSDDLPLERGYVRSIEANVVGIRHELKWFNAVSALATKRQIELLLRMPFVREIDLVGRWRRRVGDETSIEAKGTPPTAQSATSLNYGPSFTQNNQINVPAVHNYGITGQGVVIGVFDDGVRLPSHQSLISMNIIAQHDFVDHKVSVVPNDPSTSQGWHGVTTLSTIGGYFPGQLIGPAFGASYILARTENDSSETPIEEDNWAAAIQWADSIGVDVTSTSLGYCDPAHPYDPPYVSWTYVDMNGNTTLITKAADHAVQLGIVVVNSAGNAGFNASHNTLGAPADGDSVITVGAVTSAGARSSFSAVGPTTDGRIKPDIMAMGENVYVASYTSTTGYTGSSGTSYACPLAAGAAALLLCANPTLTPIQVRTALRQTANNASAPNNLYGWGVINALSAINYYGPLHNGTIRGTTFNDLNGDGTQDPGEPPVAGAKIVVTGAWTDSAFSDLSGNFLIDSLPFGHYAIREVVAPGWLKTAPADSYTVTLRFGQDTSGFAFGTFRLGSISGTKYDDLDRNGVRDSGDFPLANFTIVLSGASTLSAITDGAGHYEFTNLGPGSYTVSESAQVNWVQSLPAANGTYTVVMRSGLDTVALDFLNFYDGADSYPVSMGWNLLSLPQKMASNLKATLYPAAASKAFGYDHSYIVLDTIPNGIGYWLKFANPQNVFLPGPVRLTDSVSVKPGWNIIGTLSVPVALTGIQQNPPGTVSSNFYGYDLGGYQIVADSLRSHRGYWVKANNIGKLSLTGTGNAPAMLPRWVPSSSAELSTLTVTDAAHRSQRLSFTLDPSLNGRREEYSLPPPPPEGAFDARFPDNSALGIIAGNAGLPVLLSSAAYPVTIRWHVVDGSQMALKVDDRVVQVEGEGSALIPAPPADLRLLASMPSTGGRVLRFALEQNFPNPFNPSTLIRYEIPDAGHVRLVVYNLFGQEVARLRDALEEAGAKSVEFHAEGLPSGVYYYRITTGRASETKSMLLMK